jgi:cullin-associated NEDD8-dissociated protein 1
MVISALRYTFSDTDEAYDEFLRPIVVPMLVQMLNEPDLENRRLALMTFNSAMHNKPDIILPALDQLLPLAMKETVVKPELIREVQMGPFKHKVDDGLEIRKSAYETLYALLETSFARLSPVEVSDFFDRIVAGITDEHDIRILCNLMLTSSCSSRLIKSIRVLSLLLRISAPY